MRFAACLIGFLCCFYPFVPVQAADPSPTAQVERLNSALLGAMKNADELGFKGRYAQLKPELEELFNFGFMGRIAVGAYWKRLEAAQQRKLIDAFSELSIATYADRFSGYSGEKFEIVSAEKSVKDTILVKTNLIKSDGSPVALNYLLRPADGVYRIIDIFLDARFSELARLRADYTAVMKRDGFDALIETITSKIAALGSAGEG